MIAASNLEVRAAADLGQLSRMLPQVFALRDGITESRLLYEVFYAYFLPQFEGMEERRAMTLYRTVAEHLDAPEQLEAQRTISDILGVELVV